jgi:hypothetical protein
MAFKKVPINGSKVPSTQSNFPVYIKPSALTGWGSITLAEAQSSRWYTDESKTTEVAREIVSADEIHVKVPSLTTTTELFVDYDGVRADYAVGDTYGRNAVWSGYQGVYHHQETTGNLLDSTSNGRDVAQTNTVPSQGGGWIGNARGDYTNGYFRNTSFAGIGQAQDYTVFLSVKRIATVSSFRAVFDWGPTTGGGGQYLFRLAFPTGVSNALRLSIAKTGTGNMATVFGNATPLNDWVRIVAVYTSSNRELFLYENGSLVNSAIATSNTFGTSTGLVFGRNSENLNNDPNTVSYTDAGQLLHTAVSANWITTEYNNQSDVATFWGTVTDAGGAVANNGFMLWRA